MENIEINEQLNQIDIEIKKLDAIIKKKNKKWDYTKPVTEYSEYLKPERKRINELDRKRRMIMPYELSDLSEYGDVMSLEDFISHVKCGGFIDYDGYGNYVKDGKETNIEIYPSDVKHNSIRKEFDTIIWFNK